jgi:hypothetical protein
MRAGSIFARQVAGNPRKFCRGLSLILGDGRVHLWNEFVHDFACICRISEGVLYAADGRLDEAVHEIRFACDCRSGRHDAVAVIT